MHCCSVAMMMIMKMAAIVIMIIGTTMLGILIEFFNCLFFTMNTDPSSVNSSVNKIKLK